MTVDERKHMLKNSRERFRALEKEHPVLDRQALRLFVIKEALADMAVIGHWKDRWLTHPFPSMSEPEKAVCYLTDYDDYDEDHLAWLYNKASLRAIDAFFMQVRRRSFSPPLDTFNDAGFRCVLTIGPGDQDNDGLPDWWESLHGGDPTSLDEQRPVIREAESADVDALAHLLREEMSVHERLDERFVVRPEYDWAR